MTMNIDKFELFIEGSISPERVSSGIKYIPNVDGLRLGLPDGLIIDPENARPIPNDVTTVVLCGPKSVREREIPTDIYTNYGIYKGNDGKYYGLKYGSTSIFKQKERTGASKRGDYIKELIFCLQLYVSLKERNINHPTLSVYNGNNSYSDDMDSFAKDNLEKYYSDNLHKKELLKLQCEEFIGIVGDEQCKKITKIVNSNINYSLVRLVYAMIKKSDLRIDLAKWNPSDVWIVFDGFDDISYFDNFTGGLDEINNFLYQNIDEENYIFQNVIGLSLKLPVDKNSISIEIKNKELGNESDYHYDRYESNINTITTKLYYNYVKFDEKIDSYIELRKFNKGNVQIFSEVKTSSGKQIGGKARIYVALNNKNLYDNFTSFKKMIYNSTHSEVLDFVTKLVTSNPNSVNAKSDMLEVLNTYSSIEHTQSSQLQGLYLLYIIFQYDNIDNAIERIVRYAKSISDFSSAYLLIK